MYTPDLLRCIQSQNKDHVGQSFELDLLFVDEHVTESTQFIAVDNGFDLPIDSFREPQTKNKDPLRYLLIYIYHIDRIRKRILLTMNG